MAVLERFDPPGNVADLSPAGRQAWDRALRQIYGRLTPGFPQFIDPTETDVPDDAEEHAVTWGAFPATQRGGTPEQRWARVDRDRGLQDEYCEWSVLRGGDGRIRRVTFTSETPEYFAHLLAVEERVALDLYARLVGQRPTAAQLRGPGGGYLPTNPFNAREDGAIVHLSQRTNTLAAAVRLAAEATVLRQRDGRPVATAQDLVRCGRLGEPLRNSDPQIAAAANRLAAQGRELTLAAPPGLYLTGLLTNGMRTPDGTNPRRFWTVERGDAGHLVRARFEVPASFGYAVGDITLGGRPIQFGSQLAERVGVALNVVSYGAGRHRPVRRPCEG